MDRWRGAAAGPGVLDAAWQRHPAGDLAGQQRPGLRGSDSSGAGVGPGHPGPGLAAAAVDPAGRLPGGRAGADAADAAGAHERAAPEDVRRAGQRRAGVARRAGARRPRRRRTVLPRHHPARPAAALPQDQRAAAVLADLRRRAPEPVPGRRRRPAGTVARLAVHPLPVDLARHVLPRDLQRCLPGPGAVRIGRHASFIDAVPASLWFAALPLLAAGAHALARLARRAQASAST